MFLSMSAKIIFLPRLLGVINLKISVFNNLNQGRHKTHQILSMGGIYSHFFHFFLHCSHADLEIYAKTNQHFCSRVDQNRRPIQHRRIYQGSRGPCQINHKQHCQLYGPAQVIILFSLDLLELRSINFISSKPCF